MKLRFYLDPPSRQPHIYRHDVTETEGEEVLASPGEDRRGTEGARIAVGRTAAGRYLRVIYVPDPEPESVFVITAYTVEGKARGLQTQAGTKAPQNMKQSRFPPGWDEERVQRVLAHYETQTETEAVAEDEATLESPDQALVSVPRELVPAVRELIAKHRK